MFRSILSRSLPVARAAASSQIKARVPVVAACKVHTGTVAVPVDTDAFDQSMIQVLNHPETTGWEIRSIVQELQGMDMVPEPELINALLRSCRRVNDYALAVRILESVKFKCGSLTDIWQFLMKECQPTLEELGILTPEQMGYDKPELYLQNVFDMH